MLNGEMKVKIVIIQRTRHYSLQGSFTESTQTLMALYVLMYNASTIQTHIVAIGICSSNWFIAVRLIFACVVNFVGILNIMHSILLLFCS